MAMKRLLGFFGFWLARKCGAVRQLFPNGDPWFQTYWRLEVAPFAAEDFDRGEWERKRRQRPDRTRR